MRAEEKYFISTYEGIYYIVPYYIYYSNYGVEPKYLHKRDIYDYPIYTTHSLSEEWTLDNHRYNSLEDANKALKRIIRDVCPKCESKNVVSHTDKKLRKEHKLLMQCFECGNFWEKIKIN